MKLEHNSLSHIIYMFRIIQIATRSTIANIEKIFEEMCQNKLMGKHEI